MSRAGDVAFIGAMGVLFVIVLAGVASVFLALYMIADAVADGWVRTFVFIGLIVWTAVVAA